MLVSDLWTQLSVPVGAPAVHRAVDKQRAAVHLASENGRHRSEGMPWVGEDADGLQRGHRRPIAELSILVVSQTEGRPSPGHGAEMEHAAADLLDVLESGDLGGRRSPLSSEGAPPPHAAVGKEGRRIGVSTDDLDDLGEAGDGEGMRLVVVGAAQLTVPVLPPAAQAAVYKDGAEVFVPRSQGADATQGGAIHFEHGSGVGLGACSELAVTEPSTERISPTDHLFVLQQRTGDSVSERELPHAGERLSILLQHPLGLELVSFVHRAGLSALVGAPASHPAVRAACAAMVTPRDDFAHGAQALQPKRLRFLRESALIAVADLAEVVSTPTEASARRGGGADVAVRGEGELFDELAVSVHTSDRAFVEAPATVHGIFLQESARDSAGAPLGIEADTVPVFAALLAGAANVAATAVQRIVDDRGLAAGYRIVTVGVAGSAAIDTKADFAGGMGDVLGAARAGVIAGAAVLRIRLRVDARGTTGLRSFRTATDALGARASYTRRVASATVCVREVEVLFAAIRGVAVAIAPAFVADDSAGPFHALGVCHVGAWRAWRITSSTVLRRARGIVAAIAAGQPISVTIAASVDAALLLPARVTTGAAVGRIDRRVDAGALAS